MNNIDVSVKKKKKKKKKVNLVTVGFLFNSYYTKV